MMLRKIVSKFDGLILSISEESSNINVEELKNIVEELRKAVNLIDLFKAKTLSFEEIRNTFPCFMDQQLVDEPPKLYSTRMTDQFFNRQLDRRVFEYEPLSQIRLNMSDFHYSLADNRDYIRVDRSSPTAMQLFDFVGNTLSGGSLVRRADYQWRIYNLAKKHYCLNRLLRQYAKLIAPRPLDELFEVQPFVQMFLQEVISSFPDVGIKFVTPCTDTLQITIDAFVKEMPVRCTLSGIPDLWIKRDNGSNELPVEVKTTVYNRVKENAKVSHNTLTTATKSQLFAEVMACQLDPTHYVKGLLTDFATVNVCVLERKIDEEGHHVVLTDGSNNVIDGGHHILLGTRALTSMEVVINIVMILFIDPRLVYEELNKHIGPASMSSLSTVISEGSVQSKDKSKASSSQSLDNLRRSPRNITGAGTMAAPTAEKPSVRGVGNGTDASNTKRKALPLFDFDSDSSFEQSDGQELDSAEEFAEVSVLSLESSEGINGQPTLSEELYEEVIAAFAIFDKSKDGYIPVQDVGSVMSILGLSLSEDVLTCMISELDDTDNTGRVCLSDFLEMVANLSASRGLEYVGEVCETHSSAQL